MVKKEQNGPLVVDADYKVVGVNRSKSLILPDVNVHPVVKTGVKLVVKGAFWAVKQTGFLVIEGIKGVVSGIAEANKELNDGYREWNHGVRDVRRGDRGKSEGDGANEYYFVPKRYKRERPFWYIPTKEEEYLDMLKDRGVI